MSTLKADTIQAATTNGSLSIATQGTGGIAIDGMPHRNLIINGDMRIQQRSDVSNSTTAEYCLDRWKVNLWDGSAYIQHDTAQDTTVPSSTFTHSMKVTIDAGDASIAAGAVHIIQHRIEGLVSDQLRFGTSDAKTVTISFWIRSPVTGVHYVSLRNSALNRGYPAPYTISSADTWEHHSVTIPGDTSGTWLTTNGVGIRLSWCFGAGSTYQGTASSWEGANDVAASDQVNAVASSADVIYLTGCQLEVGAAATDFEHRDYASELARCQRYTQVMGGDNVNEMFGSGFATSTSAFQTMHDLPTEMRAAPSGTFNTAASDYMFRQGGVSTALTSVGLNQIGRTTVGIYGGVSGTPLTAYRSGFVQSVNTNALIILAAEL